MTNYSDGKFYIVENNINRKARNIGLTEARVVGAKGHNTRVAEVESLDNVVHNVFVDILSNLGQSPKDFIRHKTVVNFTELYNDLLGVGDDDKDEYLMGYYDLWDSFEKVKAVFIRTLNVGVRTK